MKRQAIEDMKRWKESPRRKPLIVSGARQVGKTWLMKEFGRAYFRETAYITFDDNPQLIAAFEGSLSPNRLLPILQAEAGVRIDKHTLLILDELRADRRSDLRCGGGSERKISRRRGLHSLWGKCAFSISTLSVSGSF